MTQDDIQFLRSLRGFRGQLTNELSQKINALFEKHGRDAVWAKIDELVEEMQHENK